MFSNRFVMPFLAVSVVALCVGSSAIAAVAPVRTENQRRQPLDRQTGMR
jgi:hypothetical protein